MQFVALDTWNLPFLLDIEYESVYWEGRDIIDSECNNEKNTGTNTLKREIVNETSVQYIR